MRRRQRLHAAAALLATAAAGGAAARLLRPRHPLPEVLAVPAESYFSAEEIARGAAFTRPQLLLGLTGAAARLAALLAAARLAPRVSRRSDPASPLAGAAIAAMLSAATALAGLGPGAAARRRALRAGLATQSWGGWAADVSKAGAIEATLAAGAGAGWTWLSQRRPEDWWLPAAGLSLLFSGALAGAAPVILDPLFNRFDPLPAGQAREDVLELAQRAGLSIREVLRVDASRRTTAANAYVSGLGPSRRVVLFDTLLERYDRQELRSVVAHELAHVQGRDVARGLAYLGAVAVPGALAVQRLAELITPLRGAPALPATALAASVVMAPVGVVAGALSRALERRADAVALDLAGDVEAFIRLEQKLAVQNLADVTPPRWVRALRPTHPPTLERIGMARGWAA